MVLDSMTDDSGESKAFVKIEPARKEHLTEEMFPLKVSVSRRNI